MNTQHPYQDRIVVNPDILVGKPVVKGTRIPVELVLERLADGLDLKTLLADYPLFLLLKVRMTPKMDPPPTVFSSRFHTSQSKRVR